MPYWNIKEVFLREKSMAWHGTQETKLSLKFKFQVFLPACIITATGIWDSSLLHMDHP